ncbi:hypothetical protein BS47DRAFT_1399225 [Hydnum rufescens UP504]|uniref:Uncharacterized protein n=1 Tax=Hydnum rufescens UP504 TaxID=1448309 RepID=A0A9P6AK44_9AGAM|nr:hypothetical protein BS47DRAFT_1399225 [Hydnum rufescens UP504]
MICVIGVFVWKYHFFMYGIRPPWHTMSPNQYIMGDDATLEGLFLKKSAWTGHLDGLVTQRLHRSESAAAPASYNSPTPRNQRRSQHHPSLRGRVGAGFWDGSTEDKVDESWSMTYRYAGVASVAGTIPAAGCALERGMTERPGTCVDPPGTPRRIAEVGPGKRGQEEAGCSSPSDCVAESGKKHLGIAYKSGAREAADWHMRSLAYWPASRLLPEQTAWLPLHSIPHAHLVLSRDARQFSPLRNAHRSMTPPRRPSQLAAFAAVRGRAVP